MNRSDPSPTSPRRKVLISTDAANEADDQFAVAHALLSPVLDVRGVLPAHFGRNGSRAASRAEVDRLCDLMSVGDSITIADGAEGALTDAQTPRPSAASQLIIDEAHSDDRRLCIAVLGPLTDVASALLEDPSLVATDPLVVWVGGPPYEGPAGYSPEFNLVNDVPASEVVLASGVELWQIPMPVYTMVGVGHAELRERLSGTSPLGDYLVDQLIEFNTTVSYGPLDFRSLGDSPAIGALLNPLGARWSLRPPPRFTVDAQIDGVLDEHRRIRVCEGFDTRWLIEDMFAKLRAWGDAERIARAR
ncbi:nucleoside hydrolase [Microbacterium sp. NPDC087591]|uniref:nucleoside hydrolase n=1 Tax=Microbacterium sp. NPDC087591 TaxID=3364192 RepID=UPI00381050F9